jgi:hypothetical protein
MVNLADANLQLKKIEGVVVTLKPTSNDLKWDFSSASIQAINSQGSSSNKDSTDILFENKEIPTQFYRTCLMSPKFFSVINS